MRNLTEREIIRVLSNKFDQTSNLPLGYNDDVSAIPLSSKAWLIMKTDMLVASTDVPPGMTPQEIGRKAVVAAVSDFAAKGVQPQALMVSLGAPRPARAKEISELALGLNRAALEYDSQIIGGDTNQAEDLVVDIAGFGIANPKKLIRRDGARPGDMVAVTGRFGKSAAGLKILMSKRKKFGTQYRSLVNAVLHPRAQLATGIALAKAGGVTSSIDSSDGLALSLHQLAEASNVGVSLDTIPIDPKAQAFARMFRSSALDLALYGGEEYELVITVDPKKYSDLKRHVRSLINIGRVEPVSHGLTAKHDGRRLQLEERGWEHFT